MSINKLCQRLAVIALNSSKPAEVVVTQRLVHTSSVFLKNFKYRLPNHVRNHVGRIRFPVNHSDEYTIEPIPVAKTGGRGADGRIWIHRIGGGKKQWYRMIDYERKAPKEGGPLIEKVYEVRKDDFKSGNIALVASENKKRWILASENMKPGDLIKTHGEVTAMPVRATDGDAHPIGSLPLGTLVHNIFGLVARAAGCSGVYLRRIGDKCVVRMPSKREIIVPETCMVTVGRVSNVDHNITKKMKTPQEARERGIRPKSGLWQRKGGRQGRKIRPIPPPIDVTKPSKQWYIAKECTFD